MLVTSFNTRLDDRIPFKAALAAVLCSGVVSPVLAASPEETRLLGSDREEAHYQSYLPFTRVLGASGTVSGSLAESAAEAGVPPAAMAEALAALGTAIDLERDLRKGDRFYVRYERTFTAVGNPAGIGKVLWPSCAPRPRVRSPSIAFGPESPRSSALSVERPGHPPPEPLPLQNIAGISGFGLRADPFDQPARGWGPALRPTGRRGWPGAQPADHGQCADRTGGARLAVWP